jgi:hypothetical protein
MPFPLPEQASNPASFLGQALIAGPVLLLIVSFINAVWLRLAYLWLRLGRIDFDRALGTTFMATFVVGGMGYMATLTIWMLLISGDNTAARFNYLNLASPMTFFYASTASILGHALIFAHRLTDSEGQPLTFLKACTLSLVYLGFCSAFSIVYLLAGLIAFAMTK